jgi:hypothetical protein
MVDNDMHTFKKAFDLDGIKTTKHQKMLKDQLIAELKREQSASQSRVDFFRPIYSFMQSLMQKPKLALSAIGVVGVFFFWLFTLTPTTLAAKVVNNAMAQIELLSPVQIKDISLLLGASPVESLKEAKKAKDLRKVTEKEFQTEISIQKEAVGLSTIEGMNPQSMGNPVLSWSGDALQVRMLVVTWEMASPTDIANMSGVVVSSSWELNEFTWAIPEVWTITLNSSMKKKWASPVLGKNPFEIKTYLRYTDTNGHVTFLGLNAKSIPVMKHVILK